MALWPKAFFGLSIAADWNVMLDLGSECGMASRLHAFSTKTRGALTKTCTAI